ncbi:MAG TPA: ParB/RepB/Spo0J family partition protein [Clostridia bacterium]|nr:ParB/RepB/Spo0J family partition protein [Clostridia bacterium]
MEKINDVIFVDVKDIKKNPNQPRKNFDDDAINDLARSIEKVGVIQPINLRKVGSYFELIAGERRLLATIRAGFDKIPAVVIEVTDHQSAVLALIENVQREDLDFIEEAYAYKTLIEKYNITQKEVSNRVGKSQSTVSNKLRLLKLNDKILTKLAVNGLTERHGRALLKIENEDLQNEVLDYIIEKALNVKQTDVLISRKINELSKDKKRKNTKFKINTSIYVNTIKKAFQTIIDTGIDAKYEKEDKGDHIELKIRIPK